MQDQSYHRKLADAVRELESHGVCARIVGEGAGMFVLAELRDRGFELYRGKGSAVVIDRAAGENLLGEVVLESYAEAIATGLRWLQLDTAGSHQPRSETLGPWGPSHR